MARKTIPDIHAGDRFGRLSSVRLVKISGGHRFWEFNCDCGTVYVGRIRPITLGLVKGCGCVKRITANGLTHGESGTLLYRKWKEMHRRCRATDAHKARFYLNRGITVCAEWATFPPFKDWALENGFPCHVSLDRIDNDRGYEPGNCRWIDFKDQAKNTRRARKNEAPAQL